MTERRAEPAARHGFEAVDEQPRPSAWIECLDKLHAEPFYRQYKARVRALLAPAPDGLYLELGAGAGTDALALGATVIGVDRSHAMCREARERGLHAALVADAAALPLRAATVDGCWSDRTFQHLPDPHAALAELVRVARPGAPIVVVDPDYGTQAMDFPDRALARKVLDFRAHHALRNGTLAHAMADMFVVAGLERIAVERHPLVVRDPTAVDNVLGLRSWAATAAARGLLTAAEVAAWEALYDGEVAAGRFQWSVTFFITSGYKPRAVGHYDSARTSGLP
jgi:SAM-dependent methyltransferase